MRETVETDRLTEFQGRALATIWAALQAAGKTSAEHPYMRCHHETASSMDVEVGLTARAAEDTPSVRPSAPLCLWATLTSQIDSALWTS